MSDPIDTLLDHLTGHWGGQTIYAGVKLGIFESLADQPRSAEAVAEALNLDPENSYRLLRALGSLGAVEERPDGIFELSEMGELLTQDHPRSLRSFFLLEEEFEFPAWTHLPDLIRTGKKSGFKEEYGHSPYEHVDVDPEYAEVFNQAMTTASKLETAMVLEALPEDALDDISHLCDVGGGEGYLLCRLLQEHPHLTGEVLDLPTVVDDAGAVPKAMDVEDRITFTGGDMFEAVPEADGYVMKHNLHGWSDEECVQILKNIQAAAPEGSPVFSAEYVVPGAETSHYAKLYDIKIMVAAGGQQRTLDEYDELFSRAGMELVAHHEADGQPMSAVEGRVP